MSARPRVDAAHGRTRYRLALRQRVRRGADFKRIITSGARAADANLTIWMLPNVLGFTRLGLIVGARHGNAVRRNRLKRMVREAFRLSQHELPAGFDILVSPRRRDSAKKQDSPTVPACMNSLLRLAVRLAQLRY
jgi:ribonuclease P protein component